MDNLSDRNEPKYIHLLPLMILFDVIALFLGYIYQAYVNWAFLVMGGIFWAIFFWYDVKLTSIFPKYGMSEANPIFSRLMARVGLTRAAICFFGIEFLMIFVLSWCFYWVIYLFNSIWPSLIPPLTNLVALFFVSVMILGINHAFACVSNLRWMAFQRSKYSLDQP